MTNFSALTEHLIVSQYEALRAEIEKRLELRQQLLTFVLIIAGTFLSLGIQPGISSMTVFCYPVIALFLAAAFEHNDLKIGQITQYIRAEVEPFLGEVAGWETYRRQAFRDSQQTLATRGLLLLSTRGLFFTTQALTIAFGVLRTLPLSPSNVVLFSILCLVSLVATIATWFTLQHKRNRQPTILGEKGA